MVSVALGKLPIFGTARILSTTNPDRVTFQRLMMTPMTIRLSASMTARSLCHSRRFSKITASTNPPSTISNHLKVEV